MKLIHIVKGLSACSVLNHHHSLCCNELNCCKYTAVIQIQVSLFFGHCIPIFVIIITLSSLAATPVALTTTYTARPVKTKLASWSFGFQWDIMHLSISSVTNGMFIKSLCGEPHQYICLLQKCVTFGSINSLNHSLLILSLHHTRALRYLHWSGTRNALRNKC